METGAPVYSTKQVADSLGLGTAMTRKYAVALEKLTGEDIPIKRRDGRQFSLEDFQTISKAKLLVDSHKGLSVETALKMSLGAAELPNLTPALQNVDRNSLGLVQALTAAVVEGNGPVIAELRELRSELRQSRHSQGVAQEKAGDSSKSHGYFVRFAIWLENVLRR